MILVATKMVEMGWASFRQAIEQCVMLIKSCYLKFVATTFWDRRNQVRYNISAKHHVKKCQPNFVPAMNFKPKLLLAQTLYYNLSFFT